MKCLDAIENTTASASVSMLHAASKAKNVLAGELLIQISNLQLKAQHTIIQIEVCRI